ncbi:hypothetical protein [Pseudocolwellia agarivorans]|uniref:hypothetical protein n=1 Tax=Pseudocolwellia agarivorans TaxID=1911682 RepID=UPI000984658F|nr:hypothetical protein [Pseudocolwellia agarivorans]
MSNINLIDLRIDIMREVLSLCAINTSDDFDYQVISIFELENIRDYGFVIDSLYLLEDTQLAKDDFYKNGINVHESRNAKFGEAYLRMYGIFNACYLQLQALIALTSKLKIPFSKSEANQLPIFQFRTYYASHTVNTGYSSDRRSYIINRDALLGGSVEGYSSNTNGEDHFAKANILELLHEWDQFLAKNLKSISSKFTDKIELIPHDEFDLSEVIKLIKLEAETESKYT